MWHRSRRDIRHKRWREGRRQRLWARRTGVKGRRTTTSQAAVIPIAWRIRSSYRESAARARRQPDDFAPLGFAKNGAWGPQAQRIFKDLCAMLSVRTMSADLYGWSAMTFEKHWLQRIGVTQARARAALLTEGVRSRQQAACEVPWGPGVETVSMQYAA